MHIDTKTNNPVHIHAYKIYNYNATALSFIAGYTNTVIWADNIAV